MLNIKNNEERTFYMKPDTVKHRYCKRTIIRLNKN